MTMTPVPLTDLTPVAHFPKGYFLENLVVRGDGSILVTAVVQNELWHVPRPGDDVGEGATTVEPELVHRFDHPVTGIVEIDPDVFIVSVTEAYTTHESWLVRVDLRSWAPGDAVEPEQIVGFDTRARGLNGSCLLAPRVLAIADCFAGLIWRVDLDDGGRGATARVWLAHPTMNWDPDSEVAPPPQPGVNGVHYGPETGFLYYTSTAQQVFMRVPVDPASLEPAGEPEFVASIDNADDFCLHERAGFAYVTRHRASTLDRVPLQPGHGSEVRHIAGSPYDPTLAGLSAIAWRRGADDLGRVAYVTTDGGRTGLPPDGVLRGAALLRARLTPDVPPLGGRLALHDPGTLDPAQTRLFDAIHERIVPWAQSNRFVASTRGRRLIGPFNAALLAPRTSEAFLAFQAAESRHTSLDARVREVVILSVGALWRAEYELYAHTRAAERAGLSGECAAALARGQTPQEGLTDLELLAHRVACSLTTDRALGDGLYAEAEDAFGAAGVLDIVMLVGAYQTVCGMLNAFAVPAPGH